MSIPFLRDDECAILVSNAFWHLDNAFFQISLCHYHICSSNGHDRNVWCRNHELNESSTFHKLTCSMNVQPLGSGGRYTNAKSRANITNVMSSRTHLLYAAIRNKRTRVTNRTNHSHTTNSCFPCAAMQNWRMRPGCNMSIYTNSQTGVRPEFNMSILMNPHELTCSMRAQPRGNGRWVANRTTSEYPRRVRTPSLDVSWWQAACNFIFILNSTKKRMHT